MAEISRLRYDKQREAVRTVSKLPNTGRLLLTHQVRFSISRNYFGLKRLDTFGRLFLYFLHAAQLLISFSHPIMHTRRFFKRNLFEKELFAPERNKFFLLE